MNEIVPTKSFEERIKDRIRDSLGELMTDEELATLIEKGVDSIFFKPRFVQGEYGHNHNEPPLIEEMLAKELKPRVEKAVASYIKAHEDEVSSAIQENITKDIGRTLIAVMQNLFGGVFSNFQYELEQRLRSM